MLTLILLSVAFLLLLLISLSVPIIKSIYLFKLVAHVSGILNSSVNGNVKYGVWGYCISPIDVSVAIFRQDTSGRCSKPRLGYTFDSTVATVLNVSGLQNLISQTLTAVLILHPISCGLTFLALLISLFVLVRRDIRMGRLPSFLAFGIGILAAIITTLAFLIDVILVAIVRKQVHKETYGDLTLVWGNAIWMSLGATIALWGAVIGASIAICPCGKRRNRNRKSKSKY